MQDGRIRSLPGPVNSEEVKGEHSSLANRRAQPASTELSSAQRRNSDDLLEVGEFNFEQNLMSSVRQNFEMEEEYRHAGEDSSDDGSDDGFHGQVKNISTSLCGKRL